MKIMQPIQERVGDCARELMAAFQDGSHDYVRLYLQQAELMLYELCQYLASRMPEGEDRVGLRTTLYQRPLNVDRVQAYLNRSLPDWPQHADQGIEQLHSLWVKRIGRPV